MAGGVPLDPYGGPSSVFPPLGPATGLKPYKPTGWYRCVLQGKVLPCQARITRASCKLKRDGKPKKGTDGANPTYSGLDPQPLELELTTFTDADREQLANVLSPYIPTPGVKPKSVSIDHPSLRLIRVSAVDIIGASALLPEPGTTKAKMTLELVHSLPAKKGNATTTPKGTPLRTPSNVRLVANPKPTQQPGLFTPSLKLKAP